VLERLDLLKRNMLTCSETLSEAASWSAMVREVHASFAAQALSRAAAQLEQLQRSERVLRNVPGGAERTRTLHMFADQLEKVHLSLLLFFNHSLFSMSFCTLLLPLALPLF